jgi:serine protease inhibitor
MQKQFSESQIYAWMYTSKLEWVQLSMPRFAIQHNVHVNDILRQLGIVSAYTHNADFSGMNGLHNLMLNDVLQQAIIQVDENGIIATAATKGNIGLKSFRESILPKVLQVNRPFFFFVADDATKTILFMGSVDQPAPSSEKP